MYETVLFPTDGSADSMEAFDHALDLAKTYDADLHALYVVDTSYPYGDFDGGVIDIEPVLDSLRDAGQRTIESIGSRADQAGIPCIGAIREDSIIHRAILEHAEEIDADVIVMATHGRRGIDRWVLGSVTERVVRTATVPVLTVRTGRGTERAE